MDSADGLSRFARPDELVAHAAFVRRLACGMARGDADADDAAQEAWLAALKAPPKDGAKLRAWLGTTVRRFLSRSRRAGVRRRDREAAAARREPTPSAADLAARAQTMLRVATEVCALGEPYREAVLLRFYEGLPPREIAARLGVPVETVRVRLRRALARLRERLGGDESSRARGLAVLLGGIPPADGVAPAGALVGGTLLAVKSKSVALAAVVALVATSAYWGLRPSSAGGGAADAVGGVAGTAAGGGGSGVVAPSGVVAAAPFRDAPESAPASQPDRTFELHGTVVGPTGAPVAGAAVTTARDLSGEASRVWDSAARFETGPGTTTDADGRFRVRLPPGRAHRVTASAPGFAAAEKDPAYAGERVELRLERGATVTGRVVRDPDAAPVAGAEVHLRRRLGNTVRATKTDERGVFAFADVPSGPHELEAGCATGVVYPGVEFHVPEGATVERTLTMETGHVVVGRAFDSETKRGVPGARVRGMHGAQAVVTDEDGRFELRGFTFPRLYGVNLTVSAAGYASYGLMMSQPEPGGRIEIELPLSPETVVRGRVVDGDGRPIPGAWTTLFANAAHDEGRVHAGATTARADRDGRFAVGGASAEPGHTLAVAADGFGRRVFVLPKTPEGSREIALGDVVLGEGGEISGELVDEVGKPRAGERLTLRWWSSDFNRYEAGRPLETFTQLRARTDDLGRFRWGDLSPGEYEFDLSGVFGLHAPEPVVVRLSPGDMSKSARLVCGRGLKIAGRVVAAGGRVPPDVVVRFRHEDRPDDREGYVHTALSDGAFEIPGLDAGRWRLVVEPFAAHPDDLPIGRFVVGAFEAGREGLVVQLPRFVRQRGRVIDFAGRPVCGAHVYHDDGDFWKPTYDFSKLDGAFTLVVPFGVPSDFVATPPKVAVSDPMKGQSVGWAEERSVALRDVRPDGVEEIVLRVRSG